MLHHKIIASVVALVLAPALAGCEDPREYDLSLSPYLTLEEVTPQYVRFSWDCYEDAVELRVERKVHGESFSIYTRLPPTVREYTDDTVEPGDTYKYRLRGMFTNGGTDRSVILRVDVPEEPEPAPLIVVSSVEGLVSPDGTRAARIVDERVSITDLRTGLNFPATRFEFGPETDVAWMPDSRRILLVAGPVGASHLYLHDPDSGEGVLLAENATDPEVASDGQHVSFVVAGVTHTMSIELWVNGR